MTRTVLPGQNSRTALGLIAGVAIAAGGLTLLLGAHALATTWESLGPGAWGGTTDPEAERTYQIIGLVVLVFGLALLALAFHRWLTADRAAPPKPAAHEPPSPPARRCPQCGTTVRPDAPE